MVYDRQRRGPAVVGISLAVNLTKEQAERIERTLMDKRERGIIPD
jgi:F0F1-type ATP synthase delta subunit